MDVNSFQRQGIKTQILAPAPPLPSSVISPKLLNLFKQASIAPAVRWECTTLWRSQASARAKCRLNLQMANVRDD